jgi:hypothetical protein
MSLKFFLRKNKKKAIQFGLMLGTILGSAALNYSIVHNPIVFVMIMALFIHELGHYITSKHKGANPDFPYFIPLFPLVIGVTRIKNLDKQHAPSVLFSGPAFASLFILVFILFNYFYNIFSVISLFILLAFEIILNYFGSDGRKYRKIKFQTA